MIVRYRIQGDGLSIAQLQAAVPPAFTVSAATTAPPGFFDVTVTPNLDAAGHADLNDYMAQLGLVFVEDDPTTPLCPIEIIFPPEYNNDKGDYNVHYIAAGGSSFFTFRVPWDFVKLDKLVMLAIPNNTSNTGDMDLSSDYGKVGEQYNAHSESNAGVPFSGTAGELTEIDITSVFSTLEAGDACGLFLNQNGITGGVNYLGILMEYSNT